MSLLEVKNISLRFGGLVAVDRVSFGLIKGEVLSIIGPNGAGKTSLFNLVSGLYAPTEGSVFFEGKKLEKTATMPELLQSFFVSLLLSAVFVLLINAQELWSAAVTSLYAYKQEFSYLQGFNAAIELLGSLDFSWTLYPFLAAFALCIAATFSFISAARICPLVAARAGISRTFQNLRLMADSSVIENVKVACRKRYAPGILSAAFNAPKARSYEAAVERTAFESLKMLDLEHIAHREAASLPYGTLRRVEIARALASNPKVLMLDEPAAGLNPSESQDLLELIKKIAQSGVTVLLIEHDMSVVMNVSDRIIVLHHGKKIAEGTPSEVQANPEVTKAYLG